MNKKKYRITNKQRLTFGRDGFLVIRKFYDVKKEILPIQRGVYDLISLIVKKYGLNVKRKPFSPNTFYQGYLELIAHDRSMGGELYDAIKMLPCLISLLSSKKHQDVFSQLRDTDFPGIAAAGHGIRIDNPFEAKFCAPWHQDYLAQLRSLDGIVFWTSLVPVTDLLGPVKFCVGSHKDGLRKVHVDPSRPDAYGLILQDCEKVIKQYRVASPLTKPGDLVLIDYLTLHASSLNRGKHSRWSVQMRYFNFKDPLGTKIKWRGASAPAPQPVGQALGDVHPELIASEKKRSEVGRMVHV
jgi:hypothetical protein